MRRGISAAVASCALLLATGCGSSSTPTTGTSANAAAGTSTGKTTGAFKPAGSAPEAVKVDTTPKFASPSPSTPVESGTVQIAYRDITIEPDAIRVKVGSTIKWTNYDSEQANVTSIGGPQRIASKGFGEGGTFEVKVDAPGVIHYVCTLYPVTMNGTIEVVS
jgi:plastocyanin